jgi:esterase
VAVLHHEKVTAEGGEPANWMYVLHGIFGAGRNWGSVVRRVVRARPEWGALLIDLRQHGSSRDFPPPHTVDAAAADLGQLAAHTGIVPDAILGHSFGGKVALQFAGGAAGAAALTSLRQVWVVDSTPDARSPAGSAWHMLQLVKDMPDRFARREDLVHGLESGGMSAGVAQWMATNLEPSDGGYRWRFDLASLEALLSSFFETDAWPAVESPPAHVSLHFVRATGSDVLSGATLERLRSHVSARVHLHEVAGGHWVNADNPAAIEALLVQLLPPA